jgi:thiosulfate dehydrogenase [quinone] large subunit
MAQQTATLRRSSHLLGALIGLIVLFATLTAGYSFVDAAWAKWNNPAWTGHQAGTAVSGFIKNANQQAVKSDKNPNPDVLPATRDVNNAFFNKHTRLFAWMVALGELLVPISLLIVLCVRFPGSRAIALALAGLATLMNFLYMFEGSSGLNPPMVFMWLAVVWLLATMPTVALFYAIDLRGRSGGTPTERAGRPENSRVQWIFFSIVLLVIGIGAWVMYPARVFAILLLATMILAGLLWTINERIARPARGSRPFAIRRKRGTASVQ